MVGSIYIAEGTWLMGPEYGEPTVEEDALGTDGAEADESNDGGTSCLSCMLLSDADLTMSYLES